MDKAKDGEKEHTLTAKQERFCQLYTTHWNATRAAKEAGYSEKSAMELGYQLLQNPSVKKRIEELGEHALKEIGVTRERILTELARIAFLDPADAYDEIGQLKPIREMPEDVRRAVSKVKIFEVFSHANGEKELTGFTKEVEFAPKKGALDSLSKCLGIAPDRVEHSGPNGKPIETLSKDEPTDEQLDAKIMALAEKLFPQKNEGQSNA